MMFYLCVKSLLSGLNVIVRGSEMVLFIVVWTRRRRFVVVGLKYGLWCCFFCVLVCFVLSVFFFCCFEMV